MIKPQDPSILSGGSRGLLRSLGFEPAMLIGRDALAAVEENRARTVCPGALYLFGVFYLVAAWEAMAASICAFTADMLKLAPACIGGKSMKLCASRATSCCTKTKRQNW